MAQQQEPQDSKTFEQVAVLVDTMQAEMKVLKGRDSKREAEKAKEILRPVAKDTFREGILLQWYILGVLILYMPFSSLHLD